MNGWGERRKGMCHAILVGSANPSILPKDRRRDQSHNRSIKAHDPTNVTKGVTKGRLKSMIENL